MEEEAPESLQYSETKSILHSQEGPSRDKTASVQIVVPQTTKSTQVNLCPSNRRPHSMSSDVIGQVLGPCGKWQLKAILLIYLTKIPSSWFMACVIFTAPAPQFGEFFCEPSNASLAVTPHNASDWIRAAHPVVQDPHDKDFKIDYCNVYENAHSRAEALMTSDPTSKSALTMQESSVRPCESFKYFPNYTSAVTQFDLVCSRDILVSVTQFFHLFGVLWGGIIATKLMEFISPRNLMLIGMVAQIGFGSLTGSVNSYMLHVMGRCFSAISCGQMYTAGSVIFTDITSGKYKTTAVALFEQFWSIGVILLPGVAHFWSSWSQLYVAISVPTVLLMYLWRWIPDSPRWHLRRGSLEKAKEILLEAAEFNGNLDLVPKDIDQLLQQESEKEAPPEPGWCSMWKGRRTVINLVCCHLAWSIYIVVYYGYLLNIRVYGRGYLEENTVIAALCEIAGTFIGYWLIMHTTRKWMWTSLLNFIGGFVSYLIWALPPDLKGSPKVALLMATSMVAKVSISSTLTMLTTCSTEIVPDNKKRVCAYSTVVWARIWLLSAPFVGASGYFFGKYVPQTVLGTLTILGAVLTSYIDVPRTFPRTKKNEAKYPAEIKPESFILNSKI